MSWSIATNSADFFSTSALRSAFSFEHSSDERCVDSILCPAIVKASFLNPLICSMEILNRSIELRKTTRVLAQKQTSLGNSGSNATRNKTSSKIGSKAENKTDNRSNTGSQNESNNQSQSSAQTVYKKCNYKTGEDLYGYWWGGKNLHLKKGNTIIIGEWSHVREEFPAPKNRFNIKTNSNCVLRPGEKVELKDEPVMINGHAWIAIYGDSIQE